MAKVARKSARKFAPPPPQTPEERLAAIESVIAYLADKADVATITQQVAGVDKRLVRVEDQVARIEEKLAGLDKRLVRVEDRLVLVEDRLARVEAQVAEIDKRLVQVADRLARVEDRLVRVEDLVAGVDKRVVRIEEKLDGIVTGKADKADVEKLRTDMQANETEAVRRDGLRTRWDIGVIFSVAMLAIAVVGMLLKVLAALPAAG
ncbi:MAG: hypothetical protein OD918_02120 [Gammaproteobacteria bacterium]